MKINLFKTLLSTSFIFLIVIIYSCGKNYIVEPTVNSGFLFEAKSYITSLSNSEKSLLNLPFSELSENSVLRKFARISKLEGSAKWEKAKDYYRNGINYSIIPVDEHLYQPNSSAIESSRYLLFSKKDGHIIQMNIIEIYSNENTSLGTDLETTVRISAENRLFNEQKNIPGLSASVFFYNCYYFNIGSYSFNNGSLENVNIVCKNTYKKLSTNGESKTFSGNVISPNNNGPIASLKGGQGNCQTYYLVMYSYDKSTGEILSAKIIGTVIDCDDENPNGQSPGSSDKNTNPSSKSKSIVNNLTNPCLSNLLNRKASSLSDYISFALNNENTTQPMEFSFSPQDEPEEGVNGGLLSRGIDVDGNPIYSIGVDQKKLSSFSQEYIFRFFLHESIHAVLLSKGNLWDNTLHHNAMSYQYRDLISAALKENFPTISSTDADALAWEGLSDSDAWKKMDPVEQFEIMKIIYRYQNPIKYATGTHC
jgi:hypothetical protein